jgi:hypothetical protein
VPFYIPEKVFWRSLPEISLLFFFFISFANLKDLITYPTFGIDALYICICMAQCLASSQTFSQLWLRDFWRWVHQTY